MNIFERYKIKYQKDGIWRIISVLLSKINYTTKFSSFIEKKKFYLIKNILRKSKNAVLHGLYKSVKLSDQLSWNKNLNDLGPKLLGCYEQQVQDEIIYLKKKYNLKYFIQFGCSEGFHVLGLLKNNIFKKAFVFEKDIESRKILTTNIKMNNIHNITVFENASFNPISTFLRKNANKTLFLIDIEGEEFNILNKKNILNFKDSFLIIENHENFVKKKKIKKNFFKLINDNFTVRYLENSSRNPHSYKCLSHLNDDEKFLLMSENRPQNMNWLVPLPNNR